MQIRKSITIIICTLIATLGILFLVLLLETSKVSKIEEEYNGKIRVEEFKKNTLRECLVEANTAYLAKWNSTCKVRGLEDDCGLDAEAHKILEDLLARDQDRCYLAK